MTGEDKGIWNCLCRRCCLFLLHLLFHDIPYVLDRLFRRLEFTANRSQRRQPWRRTEEPVKRVVSKTSPATIMLVTVAVFSIYGPTFDAFCSLGLHWSVFGTAGLFSVLFILWAGKRFLNVVIAVIDRYANEFLKEEGGAIRKSVLKAILLVVPLLFAFILLRLSYYHFAAVFTTPDFCSGAEMRPIAWIQLLLAGLLVPAILWMDCSRRWLNVTRWIYPLFPLIFFIMLFLLMRLIGGPIIGDDINREADGLPYVNTYLLSLALLTIPLLFSSKLTSALFSRFRDPRFVPRQCAQAISDEEKGFVERLGSRLTKTELFAGAPSLPELSCPRICYGLLINPGRHLLHLLLLPALLVLVAPHDMVKLYGLLGLIGSYVIIYSGGIAMRWDRILFVMRRYFFQGLPLLLSMVVIGLGIARAFDVHYVASVLDVAPFGAVTQIIVMLYAMFWFYDIWLNRPMQRELFLLLRDAANTQPRRDKGKKDTEFAINNYPCLLDRQPEATSAGGIDVKNTERDLQLHGSSSFAVVGDIESREGAEPGGLVSVYQVWDPVSLFEKLVGDDDSNETTQTEPALITGFRSLRRRIRLYRGVMNAMALIVLAVPLIVIHLSGGAYDDANLQVDYLRAGPAASFDLVESLAGHAVDGRPAIVVAASGGGTRAALYAQTVLKGLARIRALENVVLLSGVSGGGVALAYFAGHYEDLVKSDVQGNVWDDFGMRMAAPFIQDVLEGILEPRLLWRTRIGVLLAESFQRRLAIDARHDKVAESPVGLVLNTTITGHPYQDTSLTRELFAGQIDTLPAEDVPAYTTHQGGRLLLTNLADVGMFPPAAGALADDIYYPVVALQDNSQIRLMQAGALNANFPPVFRNAPIDLRTEEGLRRYYVTDGGAVENRGLITVLYLLRDAVEKLTGSGRKAPDIYLVVAEASADSYDYSGETGLDAAFGGAKKMLANGLIHELQGQIKQMMKNAAGGPNLETFYLNMPMALRTRGGLGTHWIMPGSVQMSNPYTIKPSCDRLKITKTYYLCLLDELFFSKDKPPADQYMKECEEIMRSPTSEDEKINDWICRGDDAKTCRNPGGQADSWRALQAKYRH